MCFFVMRKNSCCQYLNSKKGWLSSFNCKVVIQENMLSTCNNIIGNIQLVVSRPFAGDNQLSADTSLYSILCVCVSLFLCHLLWMPWVGLWSINFAFTGHMYLFFFLILKL